MTTADLRDILQRRERGETWREIARRYKLTLCRVVKLAQTARRLKISTAPTTTIPTAREIVAAACTKGLLQFPPRTP